MAVLAHPKTWQRPAAIVRVRPVDLTPEERANLARALRFLRVRAGSGAKLAALLGVARQTTDRAMGKRAAGGAFLALRAARLAGVPVEAVLGGAWPPEGACAHCGRG
jgi:hypothetical protein